MALIWEMKAQWMLRGADLKSIFLWKQTDPVKEFLGMNFRPVERLNFITLPKQILYQLVKLSCSTWTRAVLKNILACSHDDTDQNTKAGDSKQDRKIRLVNNNKIY